MVRLYTVVMFVSGLFLSQILFHTAYAEDVRVVSTVEGDTFDKIALRELGSVGYGRLLAEFNNISYLGALRANRDIKIPITEIIRGESLATLFVKGDALVLAGGENGPQSRLEAGAEVFVRDHILTGQTGFVSMMIPSGSVINVQPNSLVALRKLNCAASQPSCDIELETLEGSLSSQVRQRDGQPTSFKIKTPHASAAVRGTTLDVDSSDEKLLVGVTEGVVELEAMAAQTELHGGLGVKTLAGEAPGTPVPLLVAASYKRLPVRATSEDRISWHHVLGAVEYEFSLSADEALNDRRFSTKTATTSAALQPLTAATYYVEVRALDSDGLKGFGSVIPVNVVNLDTSANGPTLSRQQEQGNYIVSSRDALNESDTLEIQVSSSRDFAETTTVDVPGDGGMLYQVGDEPAYARARLIIDETTVGKFGPLLVLPQR